jgi:hypothetical protein
MSVLASALLAGLLVLLALVLLAVALPFRASARGAALDGDLSGSLRVDWAFGLLGLELAPEGAALRVAGLPIFRRRRSARLRGEREAPSRDEDDDDQDEGSGGGMAKLRAVLRNRRPLFRMAARLLGALHLSLRLRGRLGTGDPADTVALVGLLQAARALPGVQLEVEIDWLDEVLEGEAEGSARVWLAEVLAVAALLLLRREHRSALRALAS